MNPYLSREEKQHFVRGTALAALLEETIAAYADAKSTDPTFMKNLRMGRTMIAKAFTMRADALDIQAKEEFLKQTSRLEFICVSKSEAKKAHDELLALKSTIPMESQDFEDWYCAVIETTCKTCCTEKYAECPIRGILTKYGVYPIDPAAVDKCQYSYVGTPEAEELQQTDAQTVPAGKYNQAVAEIAAANAKAAKFNEQLSEYDRLKNELVDILYFDDDRPENVSMAGIVTCARNVYNDFETQDHEQMDRIRELSGKVNLLEAKLAAAAAAQEQPKKEYPVHIGLASGGKFDFTLPAPMAEAMIREIQQPRHTRSTCAQYVDSHLVAVDLQDVVTLHVDKLPPGDWVKKKPSMAAEATPTAFTESELARYRVECKCGAEYFCNMNAGRFKARCRDCQATVFADRQVDPAHDPIDGAEATLLTNRYYVSQDTEKNADRNQRQGFKRNNGTGYVEPCNVFE